MEITEKMEPEKGAPEPIKINLRSVKDRIVEACRRSGRDPDGVRLVLVSKGVSTDRILEARDAGCLVFGENKVQEALGKIERLRRESFHWHFIGHLQKNKVKHIIGLFDLIHSVDSLELAEKIHQSGARAQAVTLVLMQVNVSGEASKFGIRPEDLEKVLRACRQLSAIKVHGLMTLPPFDPDPEKSRPYFAQLRDLRDRMAALDIERIDLRHLSMGMTNDYEIAVEEGATLVRVGTGIFGRRVAV